MQINSITQNLRNQYLIWRRNSLQFALMQNSMAMISAMQSCPNLEMAHAIDNSLLLERASLNTELAMIQAELGEEDKEKKLNVLA